jgi:hypothetical protein
LAKIFKNHNIAPGSVRSPLKSVRKKIPEKMARHRKTSSLIAKLSFSSSKSRKDSTGSQSKTSDEDLAGISALHCQEP